MPISSMSKASAFAVKLLPKKVEGWKMTGGIGSSNELHAGRITTFCIERNALGDSRGRTSR